jgi:hypothetical protein
MKVLLLAKGVVLGCALAACPAHALDSVFRGTWTVVSVDGPSADIGVGTRLRFSNRTPNSVYVQIRRMAGLLRESDGENESNYVVRTDSYECYYDITIVMGRQEMTWRLVKSDGAPCVPSFRVKLDP